MKCTIISIEGGRVTTVIKTEMQEKIDHSVSKDHSMSPITDSLKGILKKSKTRMMKKRKS